jgi:simple sugar transport system permease protein
VPRLLRRLVRAAARPVLALAVAVIVAGILVALLGHDPVEVFSILLDGSLNGWSNIAVTLQQTTPLVFTGLAVAIAFKAGFWNIGVEGQMLMGALAAGFVGSQLNLPTIAEIPLCAAAAIVGGALWALVPGLLRAFLGVNELVVCLMLNPLALLLTSWVASRVLKAPGPTNKLADIADTAVLPGLSVYSQLNVGLIAGVVLILLAWLFNNFTPRGFEWRVLGVNPRFALYGGVNVRRNAIYVFLASGAVAGLAGAEEVMGVYHAYFDNFSPGYGYDGIAVAMLANYHPFGVLATAFLFGTLNSGSAVLQMMTGLSKYIVQAMQFLVVLFMAADFSALRWRLRKQPTS